MRRRHDLMSLTMSRLVAINSIDHNKSYYFRFDDTEQ